MNEDTKLPDNQEEFELDVDDLFKDDAEDTTPQPAKPLIEKSEMTKNVIERINKVKATTETEVRERIAKELGHASYADMVKARERKVVEEAGLDPKDVESVVEKLLNKRLADDPRIKRLEEIEAREKNNFVATQLKEINTATGNKFTSIDQLPPETLALWEKGISLEQAYFATQGRNLLTKKTNASNGGSLGHLANPGSGSGTKTRGLTEEEKDMYRSIVPGITEEELAKKTTEI